MKYSTPLLFVFAMSGSGVIVAAENYGNQWHFRPMEPVEHNQMRTNAPVQPQYRGYSANPRYANARMPSTQRYGFRPSPYSTNPRLVTTPNFAKQLGWPARYNPSLPSNMAPYNAYQMQNRPVARQYAGQTYQFRAPQPMVNAYMQQGGYPTTMQRPYYPVAPYMAYYQRPIATRPMMGQFPMMVGMPPMNMPPMNMPYMNNMMPVYQMPYSAWQPQRVAHQYPAPMPARHQSMSQVYAQPTYHRPEMRVVNTDVPSPVPFDVDIDNNRVATLVNDDAVLLSRRYRWRPID